MNTPDYSQLLEHAKRLSALTDQIAKSAELLSSPDADLVATVGGRESGRLNHAFAEFMALLADFATECSSVQDSEIAQIAAARLLTQSALEIVEKDLGHLTIMGRGFLGREKERYDRETAARPHLDAAVSAL